MPEDHGAAFCPLCGKGLAGEKAASPDVLSPVKINGIWILAALLLPPFLTMLSVVVMKALGAAGSDNESVSPFIALVGGALGGITSGILLGVKIGRTVATRVGLSVVFAVIMIAVSITLCLIGCTFSGYQFNLH